jgi:hypothetical protein
MGRTAQGPAIRQHTPSAEISESCSRYHSAFSRRTALAPRWRPRKLQYVIAWLLQLHRPGHGRAGSIGRQPYAPVYRRPAGNLAGIVYRLLARSHLNR